MASVAPIVLLQTATPTPGVGPDELVDYWQPFVRGVWFLAGFVVVTLLGWYVAEPAIARIIRRRNRNNPTLQDALTRYVRLLVLVVAIFVGAGVAGYGRFLRSSALVIAAGTLAIGVAGQAVIGSLVSGLALVTDPEFSVGNYIQWGDHEGTVQSITLRVTRVLTPDGELVTIPNTTLASEAVIRPFGRGRYRIVERIGLAYDDDIDAAIDHLTDVAETVDGVLAEPDPNAYVSEFDSDAIVVQVQYWVEDPRREDISRIRSAYAQAVKARLDDADITISPPSEHDLQGRLEVDRPP